MKHKQWIYALLVIFGFSCKTIVYTPKSFEGDKVMFGNGGGFSGAVTTHVLLDNGQIFTNKSLSGDTWEETIRLDRKTTKALIEKAKALELDKLDHNYPGNTYKFIRVYGPSKEHYISWGAGDHPIAKAIESYYFELVNAMKASN